MSERILEIPGEPLEEPWEVLEDIVGYLHFQTFENYRGAPRPPWGPFGMQQIRV